MKPGEIVTERFEVSECVGAGACGAVYRAWDRVLEREVAIKQLDRAIDDRVMSTSRAAARLNHPAIVPLFEVGEFDGTAFLVSEYIDGLTLRQAHDRGLVTDRDVAEIGVELCEGLHHAHERGVIHGDIKPENVIVRSREENPDPRSGRCQAKLRDFATREIVQGEDDPEGPYLTPEQSEGGEVGTPSDVFGVALLLFESWTGQNPLAGASGPRLARIRARHIPSLGDLRPDLPTRLVQVVDAALDSDPRARPDALELREWLDHVFDDLDYELAVPEPVPPSEARVRPRDLAAAAGTIAAAAGLGAAGLAPAAFALASWPAKAASRGVLAAAASLAAVAVAGTEPAAHVVVLIALWTAAAVALGALARAASPVSGAALGTAFSLAVLTLTEIVSRAGDGTGVGHLLPLGIVAGVVGAGAILISRRAASGVALVPAQDGLLPPEPEGAEIRVTAQAPLRVSESFDTAHVT